MQQRHVGKSGLKVSAIGLGCNNFGWTIDKDASAKVVDKAFDLGVTHFDTSDSYGRPWGHAETVLGELIKGRRDEIVLATKFGRTADGGTVADASRSWILEAVEGSLKRLGTDRIDLYYIHFPDPGTPMEETLRALDDIVTAGKVRYIAVSNHTPWRVVDAKWLSQTHGLAGFIASQNEYSLLARGVEQDMIPALNAYGMGLMPFFPLASGMLSGKYLTPGGAGRLADNFVGLGTRYMTPRNHEIVAKLDAFARERGHTVLELAIAWLAAQGAVSSVIAGATKPEQLEQNVKAADWSLAAEDLAAVAALTA